MANSYPVLINKLNEFIKKFYLNQLLRGAMLSAALVLALYLLLFVWAYYTYPSVTLKTLLFYVFVGLSVFALWYLVLRPALAFANVQGQMNHQQAAKLIGHFFPEVSDRLLNTLQLQELATLSGKQNALILASIEQKIAELRPIPFSKAIKLGDNKKNLRYLLPPLLIIMLIGFLAPQILKQGTWSMVHYRKELLPPAPFQFVLQNKKLKLVQGEDITLKISLVGDQFPQDMYLVEGGNRYKLDQHDKANFSYTLQQVQASKNFYFEGGGFRSTAYTLKVVPRASLLHLKAHLQFPAYLQRQPETQEQAGDLQVPEGTKITWFFTAENCEQLGFELYQKMYHIPVANQVASFQASVKQDAQYRILVRNSQLPITDTLSHTLRVLKDEYPIIEVSGQSDSLSSKAHYFYGNIRDDYGFTSLKLCYEVKKGQYAGRKSIVNIPIKAKEVAQSFFYVWRLDQVELQPGDRIDYYFEVADNDGVNGPKQSRTALQSYQLPSKHEIAQQVAQNSDALKQKLAQSMQLAKQIEKESKRLAETLLDKKELDYDDRKQLEQLLNKQQQLDEQLQAIKAQNEKNNFQKEDNQLLNQELRDKQKQIDHLLNEVLDDKTKELLQKLQQLLDQQNKEQTKSELSKMQMDNKSLKKELDRILELYKQLEFEQNLQQQLDRLKDLAQKQEELAKQTAAKAKSQQELQNQQQELNKAFKELAQEMKDLDKKNQDLERPNPFASPDKENQQIADKQAESSQELEQHKNSKATQSQRAAAQQMKQLAQKLQDQQQSGAEMSNQLNAQELRQLLENLLRLSFEQEQLMLDFRKMAITDPRYPQQVLKQNQLGNNMKIIADSLFALSKRVPQIESTVNQEVQQINQRIAQALQHLAERRSPEANREQQFAMTAINNLALMLDEALEQLQNAMKNAKSGKGKSGMAQLQQMQEQLNKNMQQAKQKLEQQGNKGQVPKGQMSEEFAKMAQQQQMLREALQKINREENKDGTGSMGNLNEAVQQMKQTELDLVNKRITQETLNRQKDLMVKLLDAERAQKEQQEDEKRESQAAKQFPPSYQKMLEHYQKEYSRALEQLQQMPPKLNNYYKNKLAEYYKLLNSTPNNKP